MDALHVGLGGNDLFRESGPADVFKTMGFFFPLTLLLTAVGIRSRVRAWVSILLGAGAVLFPLAHVQNISWLAILDAVVLVLVLGYLFAHRLELDAPQHDPSTAERGVPAPGPAA